VTVVVDASVLVAAAVDAGPEGRWAERLVEAEVLCAPGLVQVEATNILRRLELAGRIETKAATAAHRDLMQLDLDLFPFEPFAERVWELRTNLTSYDAWYVALAELLAAPLATLDRKLSRATGPTCHFLLPG
jgi:predicted nucleic acid-binding protein